MLPRLHIPPSRFDVDRRARSLAHAIADQRDRLARDQPGDAVSFSALADPASRIVLRTRSGWQGPAFVLDDGAVVWGYTGEILAVLLRLGGWERAWDATTPLDLDQARRRAR